MRLNIILVAVVVAVGVYVARVADKAAQSGNQQANATVTAERSTVRTIAAPPESQSSTSESESTNNKLPQVIRMAPSARSITLRQDNTGHYHAQARVDGMKIDFIVDTGATAVMLSTVTAGKLGIRPARSEYTAKVMTANGEIKAAIVRLDKIELDDIVVRDVRALVYGDDKMQIDLLGMTFLSQVRWTQDRGRLIIEALSNN